MAQMLVLDAEALNKIRALDERSAAAVIDYEWIVAASSVHDDRSKAKIRELNRAQTITLPIGFSVTLTHEQHRPTGAICRHVSVSHPNGVNPEAVRAIISMLGFKLPLGSQPVWIERLDAGQYAINVVEPVSGNLDEIRAESR